MNVTQGAIPKVSLVEDCNLVKSTVPHSRYKNSKIAAAFTPMGRAGRQRIFEVYLFGLRFELFLSKKQPRKNTTTNSLNKTSRTQRTNLVSPNQTEFSYALDEKLEERLSMQNESLAKVYLEDTTTTYHTSTAGKK